VVAEPGQGIQQSVELTGLFEDVEPPEHGDHALPPPLDPFIVHDQQIVVSSQFA